MMGSGIYQIKNLITGKLYVGQSLDVRRRMTQHRSILRRGISPCLNLQAAWNKHGEAAFEFSLLIRCAEGNLNLYESIAMRALSPAYNILQASNTGGSALPLSVREKIAISRRGKPRQASVGAAVGAANAARLVSQETRERMRASAIKVGRGFAVDCIETGERFSSISRAAQHIGRAESTLRQAINDGLRCAGLHFKIAAQGC